MMTTLPKNEKPPVDIWKTHLEIDFTNSNEEEVRQHFDVVNSTTSTNEALYRDEYGNTWTIDGAGLHQILRKEDFVGYDRTYNYKSAKFEAKEKHTIVRYTIKARNPIGFHNGYVPAIWAFTQHADIYIEYDMMEDPNKASWGEDTIQCNIHYGRSSADKVQNPERHDVASEAGELITYVLELNSTHAIISVDGVEVIKIPRDTIYDNDPSIRPFWGETAAILSFYYGADGWNDAPPWDDSEMPSHLITTYYKVEVLENE